MNKELIRSKYEAAAPLLILWYLYRRFKSKNSAEIEYHTNGMKPMFLQLQLDAMYELKNNKLIDVPTLIQKEHHAELLKEEMAEEGGRVFNVLATELFFQKYNQLETYDNYIQEHEMSTKKTTDWLKDFFEQKLNTYGKDTVCILDTELYNHDEINPYIGVLYLEACGYLMIKNITPPAKVIDTKEIVFEVVLLKARTIFTTSRMTYDLKSFEVKLLNGETHILSDADQSGVLLQALCQSEDYFLTHEQIANISERKSQQKISSELSRQLINELKSKLGIKTGVDNDIIENVHGRGYRLIK